MLDGSDGGIVGEDDVHVQTHELGGEVIQAIELSRGPAEFHSDILALPPAEVTQLLQKHRVLLPIRLRRRGREREHADGGHFLQWRGGEATS